MMSRMSIAPQRALSLTEELERLEQSITLTLQEIDHNFSRAHRIVSSSILPVVEQYAKNSEQVWEGAKFWKQFFEASANISLTSYEEGDQDETFATQASEADAQHGVHTGDGQELGEDETITTDDGHDPPAVTQTLDDSLADSLLSSPSIRSNRTPNGAKTSRPATGTQPSRTLSYNSNDGDESSALDQDPATPGRRPARARNMAETPGRPSPFLTSNKPTTQRKQQANDVLLHHVLDKTYRVQATPHSAHKTTGRPRPTTQRADSSSNNKTQQTRAFAFDSSPISPEMAAPQLRSDIFGSPARAAPPTPGVSVQQGKGKTPRRNNGGPSSVRKTLFAAADTQTDGAKARTDSTRAWQLDDLDDLDDTSEFDYGLGMSPPKTMQFHVPQSRLLQTPAKEASKRIVEELMQTAGANDVTETLSEFEIDETRYLGFDEGDSIGGGRSGGDGGGGGGDDSPSVVRVAPDGVDDSF